jgi:hypothetical protein
MAGPWEKYGGRGIPIGPQDPTMDYRAPAAQADLENTRTNTTRTRASIENDNARLAMQARDLQLKEEAAERQRRALSLTPGQKALDTNFASEYANWGPGGGSAGVRKQIDLMASQVPKIQGSNTVSGPIVGRLPEFMRQAINPESINVQNNIEAAIQSSLRETLGAQFTEKEGERLLARSYNPAVDEAENAQRTMRGVNELRDRAWAKDDASRYFGRTGTLQGHSPQPRPRDNQQALSYGEKQLADMIRERGLNEAQANAAWRKFYADPRVNKLRSAPRKPTAGGGWKIERVQD